MLVISNPAEERPDNSPRPTRRGPGESSLSLSFPWWGAWFFFPPAGAPWARRRVG